MTEVMAGNAAPGQWSSGRMTAVLLTGHGGYERLQLRDDVPIPVAGPNEVLIRVRAAGLNNTDMNTRIGWYSKIIKGSTADSASGGPANTSDADAGWSGTALSFPRIQGADCCGHIVTVGEGVDPRRVGERVIVRNMLRSYVNYRPF